MGLAGCVGNESLVPTGKLSGSTAAPEWSDPTRAAKLVPDDGDAQDEFSVSVAISQDGTTALVGARHDEDPNGKFAGSAYVFSRVDGSWRQRTKLVPDDGDRRDLFGHSVALAADGTTALVGARNDEGPERPSAGSAYVFSRSDGSWGQVTKLAPDGVDWLDSFGDSVALSRDGATALVAAPNDEDPGGVGVGSAYVLSRAEGSWSQQTKLAPGSRGRNFGESVALAADGTVALVGGRYEEPDSGFVGSAYLFRLDGAWSQAARFAPETGRGDDSFGESVALAADGTTALVGEMRDEDPNGDLAGSAYVFSRADGSWSQAARLVPDDGDEEDLFGYSVALARNGATAILGASTDDDPNGTEAGSAYVFSGAEGTWSQAAKLAPADGNEGDRFGESVALTADGRSALVGCHHDEAGHGEDAGSAYVYRA